MKIVTEMWKKSCNRERIRIGAIGGQGSTRSGSMYLILLALILSLGASCGGSLYKTTEIQPGEHDYPIAKGKPADFMALSVQSPPGIVFHLAAKYRASESGVGMGTGSSCQREIGLAVSAPFTLTLPLNMAPSGNERIGVVEVDKWEPGQCDWEFSEITYSIEGTRLELQQLASWGAPQQSLDSVEVDIWCTRHNIFGTAIWCESLRLLQQDSGGTISKELLLRETALGEAHEYPTYLNASTHRLTIRVHDADASNSVQ